jgi:folate-binding protein YgfZ
LLILGPKAPDVLRLLGYPALDPLRLAHVETEPGSALLLTPAAGSVPQYELRGSANYDIAGVPEVSAESLEIFRILEGRPQFGQDIRNTETARDLPQETAQTHALHFAKGCYLGQEIVERIRSRGQVHRQFTAFRLTGELPATLPAPLEAGGKPAGEITSAALVPLAEGPELLALGYARQEAIDSKQTLTYAGGVAAPRRG